MKKIEENGIEYIVFEDTDIVEKQQVVRTFAKRESLERLLENAFNACANILADNRQEENKTWQSIKRKFEIPESHELSYNFVEQRFTIIPPKHDPL